MRNILKLLFKLIIKPSEGLSAIIEKRPLVPAIFIFLLVYLMNFIFRIRYIKEMSFTLLSPFLFIFLVDFISKKIYKTESKLITFLICFLFINAVTGIFIAIVYILTLTIISHFGFSYLITFLIYIWRLILTIGAIVAIYGVNGLSAFILLIFSALPLIIINAIFLK